MKVAYLRVSSDEQRENKNIESQGIEVQKACELRSVKLDKTYRDDGVSGTIPLGKRPFGSALMKDAEAGLVEAIYIWKIDRLGRNLRDFLNLSHRLNKLGIHVESVTQPVPEGPAGRMMMHMLGAFAELDRENILENTRRGLAAKAKAGGWTGGPVPFGYRVEGAERNAKLAKHEVNADLVHRLFEMAAEGRSCQALADCLNSQGVPTSRQNPGSLWRPNSVRVIITNPIYTGTRQWGRRQWIKVEDDAGNETVHLKATPDRVIPSQVPTIADEGLWQRANAALHKNQNLNMAHAKNEYILRGLITCGICDSKYTGRGYCYSCIGRHCARRLYGHTRPPCPARPVYRAELEDTVWSACEMYISNPDKAVEELEREMESEAAHPQRVADDIRKEEDKLTRNAAARRIARIQEQDGAASHAEYLEDMKRLEKQRTAIEARLTELRQRSADRQSRARDRGAVRSVLAALRGRVKAEFTFAEKRRIVETLLAGITVPPSGDPWIEFRFHFEGPGWPRGVPTTEAELRAGAKGLRVALGATPARCGSTSLPGRATTTPRRWSHSPERRISGRTPIST
jgi:site-specific DNA recombinase